jgi:DNA-binding winged helix-turn-helix (wHTH) protein
LERPGEVVTREEIRLKLWPPGVFVDFDQGLGTAVKKLRQALNDDADFPRYIETVPRRGYRFIAPVEKFPQATCGITEQDEQPATPRPVKQAPSLIRSKAFLTVAVFVLFALGFVSKITRKSPGPTAVISGPPIQRLFLAEPTSPLFPQTAR